MFPDISAHPKYSLWKYIVNKITTSRIKGEDKIYTSYTGDAYFDKFRNKEKLKSKAEQILEKDDKDD